MTDNGISAKLRIIIPACLALFVAAGLICSIVKSRSAQKTVFSGFYFDTFVNITLYGCKSADAPKDILKICEYYDHIFSATDQNSELYRLNTAPWTPDSNKSMSVIISKELYDCILLAGRYYDVTNGRYNVAVRPLTELWDFGENSGRHIPGAQMLTTAVDSIATPSDYDLSVVTPPGSDSTASDIYRIYLHKPDIRFDLGSVAKGYVADALRDYIVERSAAKAAVIDLGGNILCVGAKPSTDIRPDRDFTIGIQAPFSISGVATVDVSVRDKSIVTSGIYQRYFMNGGKLYHHILDATTGYPADSDVVSVSIIDSSSARADVLSTVCFILGEEKARALLKKEGADAVFIYSDGSYSTTY